MAIDQHIPHKTEPAHSALPVGTAHSVRLILALQVVAAVATGVMLRFVVGLNPIWWLAWIAPVPLLLLGSLPDRRLARRLVLLAALIGCSVNASYFVSVMRLVPLAILVVVLQSLTWVFIVGVTRDIVVRYRAWWTVFAYPILWVTADTLMAALLPDGNWASLAYTQTSFLPILQVTSLFGVAGLLFVLSLVPSAIALALAHGKSLKGVWTACAATVLILGASFAYGEARLHTPVAGDTVRFGMAAIDDIIGSWSHPGDVLAVWRRYDSMVGAMSAQGATVIVLPEKISLALSPADATDWQRHFSETAARNHVWLEVGAGLQRGRGDRSQPGSSSALVGAPTGSLNTSWLFRPDGTLAATYVKHHLAPPERDTFSAGSAYSLTAVDNHAVGIAICKDMHFAALGREYALRRASVMLVPAWDFRRDDWMAANMTLTRGVESGYTIVRSTREGIMCVTDAYGRILAEKSSAFMPGATLLADAPVGEQIPTLYTRIGDAFGWLCVIAGGAMLFCGRWRERSTRNVPA